MKSRKNLIRGITVTALVVAGVACYDQFQLNQARIGLSAARSKAATLDLFSESGDFKKSRFTSKQDRNAEAALLQKAVTDFLSLVDQIIGLSDEEKSKEDELSRKLMVQWMALNPKALELLVSEMLQGSRADELRQQMAAVSLVKLAAELPESALAYLDQASAYLKDNPEHVQFLEGTIAEALKSWAKRNPLAAAQWVQENGGKYNAFLSSQAKYQILTSAASVDLNLAFRLIDQLELNSNDSAVMLARSAATPQQRTDFLQALQQNSSSIEDESLRSEMKRKAMEVIATRTLQDGFIEATGWVKSVNLDSDELGIFVSKLD